MTAAAWALTGLRAGLHWDLSGMLVVTVELSCLALTDVCWRPLPKGGHLRHLDRRIRCDRRAFNTSSAQLFWGTPAKWQSFRCLACQARPASPLAAHIGDRKLAGYFGIDVTAVRIGFVVLAVLGGSAVPLYAAGWLLIPEAGAELSIGQELSNNLRHRWAHPSR